MNDLFQEILVKRKTPAADQLKKAGLILVTVLFGAAGLLLTPLGLLPAVIMAGVCMFLFPRFDLEYEYLYVNGDIDIDKIMGKVKRKQCASYSIADLEIGAPTGSHSLDQYSSQSMKTRDFTSLTGGPSYTLIYNKEGSRERVLMELDGAILDDMRRHAPRKILRD